MPTVCVPDEKFAASLSDLQEQVDGLEVLVWDGSEPLPDGIERVEFLVPSYRLGATSAQDLAKMTSLKAIQVLSAGVEHWLPSVPPGVMLLGGRGIHGGSTAELAFAAILSHLRALPAYAVDQENQEWSRRLTGGLRTTHVLVLGAGDIGDRVAAAARIFDAEVTVVARHPRDGVVGLADVPALLPTVQVVVIAMPSTPETDRLVDAGFLAALPDGALVVNVARGSIIVTDALLAELNSGRLFAFLDVFETEPLPAGDPLWTAPNLVMTPHAGGGVKGWRPVGIRLVRAQLERYLRGEPLASLVTEGY